MSVCQRCGKALSEEQIKKHRKYCCRVCFEQQYFGEKNEWNGIQIRPGKGLEVLKLCHAGMTPREAYQAVGTHGSVVQRLMQIPGTDAILPKHVCAICGEELPLPLNRKYCSKQCAQTASYNKELEKQGRERRSIDARRQIAVDLYEQGFEPSVIAEHLDVAKQKVKNWIHWGQAKKPDDISPEVILFRPLRQQLRDVTTADEWAQILEQNAHEACAGKSIVILVCGRLHGGGAPGRYAAIAAEQFYREAFCDGIRLAFCNILRNAITTIEWRGGNFHLTRIIKPSGTFLWPDENLGRSVVVSAAAFEHLLSHKKYRKFPEKLDFSRVL